MPTINSVLLAALLTTSAAIRMKATVPRGEVKPHGVPYATSCDEVQSPTVHSANQQNFAKAWKGLCDDNHYAHLAKSWVDPKFNETYLKHYGKKGEWIPEAYTVYFSLPEEGQKARGILDMMKNLQQSVKQGSTRPLIAFNFGALGENRPEVEDWANQFPNTILMHASPMVSEGPALFNFNKFRTMMMSKVESGIQLDADMMVAPKADAFFKRVKEETTAEYPYPILPVHWMSKDDDANFAQHPYAEYDMHCPDCANRTMRWGHAHPTFTSHALPFLGKLLLTRLDKGKIGKVDSDGLEDEDALNVALWEAGATKQWCKWDVPFVSHFFEWLHDSPTVPTYEDPKWFPDGVPVVFLTAHHSVDDRESVNMLRSLKKREEELPLDHTGPSASSFLQTIAAKRELPPAIFFHRKYYNTMEEVRAANPNSKIPCMM